MSEHDDDTEDEGRALHAGALDASELDELNDTNATKREGHSERPKKPTPYEGRLPRGTSVGRYVVIDVIGRGGMGVVYSAYDPELDRRLAIKLLQAKPSNGSTSGGDQAWLLREAQALARLSHPNVIAVHDVGTLPGDRVFVAIELVEGSTLRAWLKARPRSWREVRDVMLAAGAGLAAAHAANLIHRDFKPENVLVGNDGRVRVMDFGLARLSTDETTPTSRASDRNIEARSPLSESLTIAGSVVGTPAYLAPEIYDGLPASARSDQFAFGVTFYEALFQTRPFDKQALMPPRAPPPNPKAPPSSSTPARLQHLVMRAIAVAPGERFDSMDALLAELSADPTARRRRLLVAAGVLAIGGLLTSAAARLVSPGGDGRGALLCKDSDRHLAKVWDAETKQAIGAVFAKSSRPFKDRAFAGLVRSLDGYAAEWTAAMTGNCEATKLRGEQTEDVQSLRQDCLDQRLEELRAFTQLLAKADDALVDKAGNAALGLESVKKCANVAALKAPARPLPEMRPQVDAVRARLADAKAGLLAGNLGRAINAANEAAALAKKIPFDPLVAEAKFVLGSALINVGNAPDALTALADATWAGLRGRRDDIAAEAALNAALATADGLSKDAEARIWLALGTAAAARVGGTDRALELKRLELEGIVAGRRGDYLTATAAHEQALALAIQLHGQEGVRVARDEQLLGATLLGASDYARARPHYEHALALIAAHLGPDHPDVALLLSGLGSCYHNTGDVLKSHEAFQRALAIRERVFGVNSPVLIATLNNTAELLLDEGNHADGLPMIERAKRITEATVGRAHPYYVVVTATLSDMLLVAHRTDEARAAIDESIKIAEQTRSPYLAGSLTVRAKIARLDKQWAKAAALDQRAISGFEASAGLQAPDLWKPLTGLAFAKIALGRHAEARPLLVRAIAIGEQAKVPAASLAPTRAALANLKP